MSEFKVGDRVRLTKDVSPFQAGDIGEVTALESYVRVRVAGRYSDKPGYFRADEVEVVVPLAEQYPVGTTVRITSDGFSNLDKGDITVVRDYAPQDGDKFVRVAGRDYLLGMSFPVLPDEFEVVEKQTKFAPGDRVKVTAGNEYLLSDSSKDRGVVTKVIDVNPMKSYSQYTYETDFDSEEFYDDEIELLTEEEQVEEAEPDVEALVQQAYEAVLAAKAALETLEPRLHSEKGDTLGD